MQNGLLLQAKYGLPPNLLNYCGPSDRRLLIESLEADIGELELRNILMQFEGAVPYLQLIARANGIRDIFDYRVVEAYWLGNSLLESVYSKDFYSNLETRFKKKMKNRDWLWLISGSLLKAKPFHAFHVFDIYRRAGFLKSGQKGKILETINNCKISWGRVKNVENNIIAVEYNPIIFQEGKLVFSKKKEMKIVYTIVYTKVYTIKPGDLVSFHWDYVCDKITPWQKENLKFWTQYHLNLTNRAI